MEQKKEGFASKIGFVLAAAGSAVGLGNIWRFPYLAAKYGGGIFLLIYIILACTFGFSLMIAEIAIGRKTGKSVIGAYKDVNKHFGFLGYLAALVPFIITPYYCVIGGWVLKYFTMFLTGKMAETAVVPGEGGLTFFESFIGNAGPVFLFFIIYVAINAIVVIIGVQKGIEKISKFLMPALIVIIIGIAIYTLVAIDGAGQGALYYILPNFEGFTFTQFLKTIVAAMGQLFYSLSLAMGIMVTYGSYMRKEDSLEKSVRQIEIFDTGVAVLAGLIIVPAIYAFSNGDASQMNKGPGLMFITLPRVFEEMPGGAIVGTLFFVLVALAAMTSSISLLETIVSIVSEKFKLKRVVSTLICVAIVLGVGSLSVLGYSAWSSFTIWGLQWLDFFDTISNNVMMPIVSLLTSILIIIGYVKKNRFVEDEVMRGDHKFSGKYLFRAMICVVCPIIMIVILITNFTLKL